MGLLIVLGVCVPVVLQTLIQRGGEAAPTLGSRQPAGTSVQLAMGHRAHHYS